MIVSGDSDPRVLFPSLAYGGLYNYFEALHYGGECFGLHLGGVQAADLGDGRGYSESQSRSQLTL